MGGTGGRSEFVEGVKRMVYFLIAIISVVSLLVIGYAFDEGK